MSKKVLMSIGIVGILIIVGAVAYIMRPSAEASAPIEAIPVAVEESTSEESNSAAAESTAVEEVTDEEMPAAEEVAIVAPEGAIVFTIVQAESEVRFTLDELLNGAPKTVVGVTDQVAGEIAIDPAAPANTKVGVIRVNARTFSTDNDFRNRAINNSILETGKYEFVTFTPTEIIGFPDNPIVGEALEFQISGDLTVRDVTHLTTFDISVTAVSETRLEGSASAMLARGDYKLQIPEVPRVANVDEEILLEIDFVAVTQ